MASSFADDPLRIRLRRLAGHIPFAPRLVEEALKSIDRTRLLAPVRLRVEKLLEQARARTLLRPEGSACLFPTVAQNAPVAGALFFAVAQLFRPPGACPIADAFPGESEMLRLLGEAYAGTGSLSLLPHPGDCSGDLLELVGNSAGGAFAVAAEALRRGVEVPDDVAVSAALGPGPDGSLHLRPVAGLEEKVAVLERERPGIRFFFVRGSGRPLSSARIHLHPLPSGPIDALFDAILPERRVSPRAQIYVRLREAELAFADQDYPQAGRIFREILPALEAVDEEEPRRWRLWSLICLGAIALHGGDSEEAAHFFTQAQNEAQDALLKERDELQLYVAGLYLDRLAHAEASAILVPLTDLWRQRMRLDPAGDDRRRIWLACLGGMRRLHLLAGEPERAHAFQEELLHWSPESERARSLTDLGECLRRMGRRDEASRAFAEARRSLTAVYLRTYRLQTEAFLLYYEGRLALDRGALPDLDAIAAIAPRLPERSAASWRLRQLALLGRLRAGDDEAAETLVRAARAAKTDFLRWQAGLGLLRALELRPDDRGLRSAIADHFAPLDRLAANHAPVARAHRDLLDRLARGDDPLPSARDLLRRSPY